MTKPVVIALTGKARSGKDTVAQYIATLIQTYNDTIAEEHQDMYVTGLEAFAAPVKSMVAMLLDFFSVGSIMEPTTLQAYIEGDKREETLEYLNKSPRQLMQTLGTEWGRELVSPTVWIDCMTSRINQYVEVQKHGYKGAYVVCTDMRFNNEAEAMIQRHNAVIVQVVRDDTPDSVGDEDHVSELGISPEHIDLTIVNNGDKDALLAEVQKVLGDILPDLTPRKPKEEEGDEQE